MQSKNKIKKAVPIALLLCTLIFVVAAAYMYGIDNIFTDKAKTSTSDNVAVIFDTKIGTNPMLDKLAGDYEGTYYPLGDASMSAGLLLKVYEESGHYYAIFKFQYPSIRLNANSKTDIGIFMMDVTYDSAKDEYEFSAKEWVYRPSMSWDMISFKGELNDIGIFSETSGGKNYYRVYMSKTSKEYASLTGRYEGTYTAPQGMMNAVLNVERDRYGEYTAVFAYSPNPQNPNTETGSYQMRVMFSPFYNEYVLVGVSWISQSPTYALGHLIGRLDRDSFTGDIMGNNYVGKFDLTRVSSNEGTTIDRQNSYHEESITNSYGTLVRVFTYEFNPAKEKFIVNLGNNSGQSDFMERVSTSNPNPKVQINAGFFRTTKNDEDLPITNNIGWCYSEDMAEPYYAQPDSGDIRYFKTLIIDKDGKSRIVPTSTLDSSNIREIADNAVLILSGIEEGKEGNTRRTLIGVRSDGSAILMVVDSNGGNTGMSISEAKRMLTSMDAISILNLDGGGSSRMYVQGQGDNGLVTKQWVGEPNRPIGSVLQIVEK
jgi:exopolysaccharide biosynthesis protein